MFDKILVPLDGSALAEGVLPYAEALAGRSGVMVTLLHVVDPETLERHDPDHAPYIEQLVARVEVRARDYLRHLEERVRPAVRGVETKVLLGSAPEKIVDFACRHGHDLIAMSTHGRSGVGRWVFGSVADRVLHSTPLPLLLVRPPAGDSSALPVPLRRVLAPLDGSDMAEEAVPYAVELARRLSLEIQLVRVIQYQMGAGFGLYVEDLAGDLEKAAEEYLARVQAEIERQEIRVKSALLWGYADGRILDAAQAEPGTIVVISSHGRSGIGRWVLGSVAEKVVRAVGIPVLVVRPVGLKPSSAQAVPDAERATEEKRWRKPSGRQSVSGPTSSL